jgi:hypothetical protein
MEVPECFDRTAVGSTESENRIVPGLLFLDISDQAKLRELTN